MILEITPPTLIAEGSRVQGSLTFHSHAQVFGIVEGDVHQQSLESLNIGRTGWVNGKVSAHGPILVEGRVDGDIISHTQIRLAPTATVRGSLSAPSIAIRAGAIFEGQLKMEKKATPLKKAA